MNHFEEKRSDLIDRRKPLPDHSKPREGLQKGRTTIADLSASGLRAAGGRRDSHGVPTTSRRGSVLYDIQEWFDEVNGHGKYDGGIVFARDLA